MSPLPHPEARRLTSAEFRLFLHLLGLSPRQFAALAGWDASGIARQATGLTGVSPRTQLKISELLDLANRQLSELQESYLAGASVDVPRATDDGANGLPPSWWQAVTARLILETGLRTRIEYRD